MRNVTLLAGLIAGGTDTASSHPQIVAASAVEIAREIMQLTHDDPNDPVEIRTVGERQT